MPKFVSARAAKFADRMKFKRGKVMSGKRLALAVVSAGRRKKSYGKSGPEVKFYDTFLGYTCTSTGVVTDMSAMAQGLTNVTRIANKIQIKSCQSNIFFTMDNNAAHIGNTHRFSIVLDKEPEAGAIAAYTDIYANNNPLSFRNLTNSDRFVVLAVEQITSGYEETAAGSVGHGLGNGPQYVQLFKGVDIASKFIGATGVQASVGSNQILFVNSSYTTDANMDINVTNRIRYTDE